MQRHILGQRHCQVKTECQITVTLLETVDLLFCFAAALGKKDLSILNNRGIQSSKAIKAVGFTKGLHHTLKAGLLGREQLHKAGQRTGFDSFHLHISFLGKLPATGGQYLW